MGINSRSSAPMVKSLDGKHAWLQGKGELKTQTTAIAVTPSEEGGVAADIQNAIDALTDIGGRVYLRNGTYLMEDNIVIPSNVILEGESPNGVIIDFQSQAYQIQCVGSNAYTTGTVAVNNKSATVTGTGTSWNTGMIGQSILLSGSFFVITAVASTTSLTIEAIFDAPSISGQTYVIADTVSGFGLFTFSVQNSTASTGAILYQYVSDGDLNGVAVFDSTIGLNFLDSSFVSALDFFTVDCGTGVNVNNCGVWTFNDFATYGSTTANMVINKLYNASVSNATISSSTGNGITITNSFNWALYDMTVTSNGGKGIEITDTNTIEIFAMVVQNNTSDGIKLTSNADRISIHNVSCNTNGGYGINVAAATDDKNTISSCMFNANTSGTVNNLGTGTINVNGQT